ncbi:hypothetical protein GCM10027091_30680 [Streptomyces daliensis]
MLAQRAGGEDALPHGVRQFAEGAGGEGCVVRHAGPIPTSGTGSTLCYETVDKAGQRRPKVRTFDYR